MNSNIPFSKLNSDKLIGLIEYFFLLDNRVYDSIFILSLIEQFKRLNSTSNNLELLKSISEKFELNLKWEEKDAPEILSPNYNSKYIFSDESGELFIVLKSYFNYFKIQNIITNKIIWLSKKNLVNLYLSEQKIFVLYQDYKTIFQEDEHQHGHSYFDTLLSLVKIEKKDIWILTVYSIAIGILSLVIPIGIQSLVNVLNFGTMFQPIIILTLLVVIALSFAGILSIMQFYLAELIQQRVFVRISSTVSKKISLFNQKISPKLHPPELANYFLDISNIQKSLTLLFTDGLAMFLQSIIGLLVLILYHPVFILFDILIIFIIYVTIKLLGQGGVESSIYESKAKYATESWLEEISENKNAFRSKNSTKYSTLRVEEKTKEYLKYRSKHYKILVKQLIGFLSIQILGSGFLLILGGYLVIKGEISLGQLVAAEIIVAKILDKFSKIDKYIESYYDLCASLDKINHILDLEVETNRKDSFEINLKKPFAIKINSISHNQKDEPLLLNINLEIKEGECIGFTGEIGSGKTKLFEMIYGLLKPNSGYISINSQRISEVDIFELRNSISFFSGIEIFSGSILDNVRVGNFSILESEVREALERMQFGEKLSSLEDGIMTKINRNNFPFNKVELTKILLARMIVSNSGLILLDDVFKNLDEISKPKIIKELLKEKKKSTILVSSAQVKDLSFCDSIYELKNSELKKWKSN